MVAMAQATRPVISTMRDWLAPVARVLVGAAALIATHNFELTKYMDRVMALDHGKLVRRS